MPLTGQELIDALKNVHPDADHDERMRLAGYVFTREGEERFNRQAFYQAVAEALAPGIVPPATHGRGRRLTNSATVLKQGHAVIGKAYLQQIGVSHGDRIAITADHDTLSLKKVI